MTFFAEELVKSFPPVASIFLISLTISFFITLVYKFTTNQKLMKMLHADMKSLRSEIKNTKDTTQAAQLNKRLMEKTMQQITHSMKSTFITIIPIFFIFGWMNGNIAFSEISPGEEFTASITFEKEAEGEVTLEAETLQLLSNATQQVSGERAEWTLQGEKGTHQLRYTFGEETYTREAIIAYKWDYADPHLEKKRTLLGIINIGDDNPIKPDSTIRRVSVDLSPVHPFGSFEMFGWQPGWLATYFIFTLALTFPIRRILRVH